MGKHPAECYDPSQFRNFVIMSHMLSSYHSSQSEAGVLGSIQS